MAATGNLSITKPGLGNFGCSASLIRRDVLVTSGHCFCSANFSPPIVTNATVSFTYRDIAGTLNTVNARGYAVSPSYSCDGFTSFDHADDDVAVVSLANAVPSAKMPQVLSVYTSGNLMDRIFNSVQETPSFWNGPLQMTGYSSSGAGTFSRQTGTIPHLRYENDCGFLNLASCSGYVTWGAWSDNVPQVQPGDSGGPWTFKQYDRDYTVFAVSHGGKRPVVGFQKTLGAPTFDNGRGNGTFVSNPHLAMSAIPSPPSSRGRFRACFALTGRPDRTNRSDRASTIRRSRRRPVWVRAASRQPLAVAPDSDFAVA
jgi:hypothetical protein